MYIYTRNNIVISTSEEKQEFSSQESIEGEVVEVKEYEVDIQEMDIPTFEDKQYYNQKLAYDGSEFYPIYTIDKGKIKGAQNDIVSKLATYDYRNQKLIDNIFPQILTLLQNKGLDLNLPYSKDEILSTIQERDTLREEYDNLEEFLN